MNLIANESLKRANEILLAVLDREGPERAAYLDRACGGDEEVRGVVESLLAADPEVMDLLDRPAAELLELDLGEGVEIGPFRVLRVLGRGGMGTVYQAVHIKDPGRRSVAIKILKPGMDSAEIVRRFRAEGTILARLKHPYIAEFYDGGTTADHRPYFVMEHVEGEPIHHHCDNNRLSIRRRLEVFLEVCSAVQFAHQKLVVHRDLKPANILVTARGEPKLLDFGIAKLLDPETHLPATTTFPGLRPMTPEYASPEQVLGEPITTATDLYSLGVVLYQLLTGRRPYGPLGSLSGDEMRRVICEQRPERPSIVVTREEEAFSADGGGQESSPEEVARKRASEPRKLRRQLSGDLDSIVLKALRKEPAYRYGSVEQLSEDLWRYLEGRAVRASKGTFTYRAGKFVRRKKKALAAAAIGVLFLAGVAIDREILQRRTARQRDRAQQVSQLLVELFNVQDLSEPREIIDRGVERIRRDLGGEPELLATMTAKMGELYAGLGHLQEAAEQLEEALAAQRRLLGGEAPEVVETLNNLAAVYQKMGGYARAESLFRQLLALKRKILGLDHPEVASSLNDLGTLLRRRGDFAGAERCLREALDLDRRLFGPHNVSVRALVLNNLGMVLLNLGDYAGAEGLFRESLSLVREYLGSDDPSLAPTLSNLGALLSERGDYAGAEPLLLEALELKRRYLGPDHPQVVPTLNNLAMFYWERGDDARAEPLLRESLELERLHYGEDHPDVVSIMFNLGRLLQDRGDYEEAEPLLRQALDVGRLRLGEDHPDTAWAMCHLARVPQVRDTPEGTELARLAVDTLRRKLPPGHWRVAYAESVLAASMSRAGRFQEAESLMLLAVPVMRSQRTDSAKVTREVLRRLVKVYEAWGRPEKAAVYREILDAGPPAQDRGLRRRALRGS